MLSRKPEYHTKVRLEKTHLRRSTCQRECVETSQSWFNLQTVALNKGGAGRSSSMALWQIGVDMKINLSTSVLKVSAAFFDFCFLAINVIFHTYIDFFFKNPEMLFFFYIFHADATPSCHRQRSNHNWMLSKLRFLNQRHCRFPAVEIHNFVLNLMCLDCIRQTGSNTTELDLGLVQFVCSMLFCKTALYQLWI